ncbi:MAG TPA: DUF2235 domain-containing protein [Roseiarcus sp.]|nr:DUF2235 domain-containing protein [Roseiarcus sp.]
MKRIVILIDGTWCEEGSGDATNVAKLDPASAGAGAPLIKAFGNDGVAQHVVYHEGVGADPDFLKHWLGGSIGLGLKGIVLAAYKSLVDLYNHGDDVFLLGFSRGAYAARALVGMIGASGIVRQAAPGHLEIAWANYRVDPSRRAAPATASGSDKKALNALQDLRNAGQTHPDNSVKCVGVWDTVGSYGVPAGFGLAALARYISLYSLGFHDTTFGDHVEFGFHAVAVDERRRPFVPTFWTIKKGEQPKGHVEQTWFAGSHGNIGGGEADPRLSDLALVWMIARMQALTGLSFDADAVRAVAHRADIDGEVYDSTVGWPIDHLWPHLRKILSPEAVIHGPFFNRAFSDREHINERVHWSAMRKRGRPGRVFGVDGTVYDPPNLPQNIPAGKIAEMTPEEAYFVGEST